MLKPHPRLYATRAQLGRAGQAPHLPVLRAAAEQVAQQADQYVGSPTFAYDEHTHNALLNRARRMQSRVVTLLVRWLQTQEPVYRNAVVAHIQELGRWPYWSWDCWRRRDRRFEAAFDLSYGENSATLAIAYDWLFDTLSPPERQQFIQIARRRALGPFLVHTHPDKPAGWFGKPDTNWNTVCAGGAGMLALAMHDDLPEAVEALARADRSITPFMQSLEQTGGGWPEGIGYWNYGMRYAFMFLLSHENAFGQPHPLLDAPATKQTLPFPLDFCPNRQPCSFGDVNNWQPLPFHYAAAVRTKSQAVVSALDAHLAAAPFPLRTTWPDAAELLVFHPRRPARTLAFQQSVAKQYRGLDWCVLADRMPGPRVYLSIRGGSTQVPHSHLDLMSFHGVVGDETLIHNLGVGEYLDTTFTARRFELFETTPASKNTLLLNGVGVAENTSAVTHVVKSNGLRGVHIDATGAMGVSRGGPAARFCGRLFLMLHDRVFLILDRIEMPHAGRAEGRLHTFADVTPGDTGSEALIHGRRETLRVAYACDVPAVLQTAVAALTKPGPGPTVLRWCTQARSHTVVTMATLLSPGDGDASVALHRDGARLVATVNSPEVQATVSVSPRLRSPRIER